MADLKRNLAILVLVDAEALDFAAPFEVFSVTSELAGHRHFNVFLVAEEGGRSSRVRAANRMCILSQVPAEQDTTGSVHGDILSIPGARP